MDDAELFLLSAVAILALTALLAVSKRWNPSHDGWMFPMPWRYLRVAIFALGVMFTVVGLSGLGAGSRQAMPFLVAGILLVAVIYSVGVLMGDDDDL